MTRGLSFIHDWATIKPKIHIPNKPATND